MCKCMFPMKFGLLSIKILYIGSHKKYLIHYDLWGILKRFKSIFLKRILAYLYFTKYNEINIFHLDAQKHVSYTGYTKDLCEKIMGYALKRQEIHFQLCSMIFQTFQLS